MQLGQRIEARGQAQHQFIDVEACQHRLPVQARGRVLALGATQLRQLAGQHRIETDGLQWLQRRTQRLLFRPLHTARQQAETAMLLRQHFHQQAGFAPRTRMQDVSGLVFETHAEKRRSG